MSNGWLDQAAHRSIVCVAAEWHARQATGELSAAERIEFLEWLRARPEHVSVYLRALKMTQLLPEVLADLHIQGEDAREILESSRNVIPFDRPPDYETCEPQGERRPKWRLMAMAMVAAVVLLVAAGSLITVSRIWGFATTSVVRGAQRTLTLDDGSMVDLNSESKIRVRISSKLRLIDLVNGQALFSVAHDKSRPFIVRAGGTEVTALGTRFDVYRRPHSTSVTVVQGTIEVKPPSSAAANTAPGTGRDQKLKLAEGYRLHIDDAMGVTAAPRVVDITDATAWTRREVSFKNETLENVIVEFERYLPTHIWIEDGELRQKRVTGVLGAYDSASLVRYLRGFPDIEVQESVDAIHLRLRQSEESSQYRSSEPLTMQK